jgi:hypothetical protein
MHRVYWRIVAVLLVLSATLYTWSNVGKVEDLSYPVIVYQWLMMIIWWTVVAWAAIAFFVVWRFFGTHLIAYLEADIFHADGYSGYGDIVGPSLRFLLLYIFIVGGWLIVGLFTLGADLLEPYILGLVALYVIVPAWWLRSVLLPMRSGIMLAKSRAILVAEERIRTLDALYTDRPTDGVAAQLREAHLTKDWISTVQTWPIKRHVRIPLVLLYLIPFLSYAADLLRDISQ